MKDFKVSNTYSDKVFPCPICETPLQKKSTTYSTDALFALWAPVEFSPTVRKEHNDQSECTTLYSCPECQLEIFLPPIIGSAGFYIDAYNLDGRQPKSEFTYADEKWEFSEALKNIAPGESIVEIGCGNGNFLLKARARASRVLGIEFNQKAIQICQEKGLPVLGIDDPIIAGRGDYDLVFSFHVLEHVADPVRFIMNLFDWIKPNGKIGISVPNQDGPIKYIDPCISNMPPHHATRWHAKTFKTIAKKLDLHIEKIVFEPLVFQDSYYYSKYWVDFLCDGKTVLGKFLNRSLKRIVSRSLHLLFSLLKIFNRRSLSLLKGQSVFVLLSKPNRPI